MPIRVTQSGINLMASRRLVNLILNIRKHCAGLLLGVIKKVKNNPCISNGHFGERYHVASCDPYFYQACYKDAPSSDNCNDVNIDDNVINNIVKDNIDNNIDVVDDNVIEKNGGINMDKDDKNNCNGKGNKKGAVKLPCNENCKALTDSETDSIAELKEAFSKPIEEFRNALKNVDSGCPNEHDPQKNGHPLICSEENGGCKSTLRILRAASPHYPMLRTFLHNVYDAIKFDNAVSVIDKALAEGDVDTLIKISSESDQNNEKCNIGEIFSSRSESDINLRDPDLEVKLIKENINLIAEYQKEIEKTMSTLGNAKDFRPTSLPNPELYIILNGQPTKN